MGILSEFKAFALKGNVVDMAVGVIVGGAFGKIVSSLVSDVLLPVVGLATGDINFSERKFELRPAVDGQAAVTLNYGTFLDTIVQFLIVAFCLFLVIKGMNAAKEAEAALVHARGDKGAGAPPAPPPPTRQELLLEEIRDLLRKR